MGEDAFGTAALIEVVVDQRDAQLLGPGPRKNEGDRGAL
jgi:hypothetical protein